LEKTEQAELHLGGLLIPSAQPLQPIGHRVVFHIPALLTVNQKLEIKQVGPFSTLDDHSRQHS
jgi:hypothetical protein